VPGAFAPLLAHERDVPTCLLTVAIAKDIEPFDEYPPHLRLQLCLLG